MTLSEVNSERPESPLKKAGHLQHLFRPAEAGANLTMYHIYGKKTAEKRPFFAELETFNRENLTPSPTKGPDGP